MNKKTRLKPDEVRYLATLSQEDLASRLLALSEVGWSLNILAQSLNPPRAKSTVHFWVKNATPKEQEHPVPPIPPKIIPTAKGISVRSVAPSVPMYLVDRLKELAALSSRYRANTPKDSEIALANVEFTDLAYKLAQRGVPAADIAQAAGVSYRAVARRIANA